MVFIKGMRPTKGFKGKKHSKYSKWQMSESRKRTWAKKRGDNL